MRSSRSPVEIGSDVPPMPNRRIARLNEQMKREISEILRREVQDPRVGMPTVTGVAITPDLYVASVYVRPDPTLGDDPERAFLDGLKSTPPAPGFEEVLVPGDYEHRSRVERLEQGMDVPETTLDQMQEWAGKLAVPMDESVVEASDRASY